MSLPKLSPYFSSRGRGAEREMMLARKQNQEAQMRQKWVDHSKYLKTWGTLAERQNVWTSSQSYDDSMATYRALKEKEEKQKRLQERKDKLKKLLEDERAQLQVELKEIPVDKIATMKARAEELKTAREERRKQIAKEKLAEHWRDNCPQLRQTESRMMARATRQHWKIQQEEKRKAAEAEERDRERFEQEQEEERLLALQEEEEKQREKERKEKEHVLGLKQQMMEIKAKEEEAQRLEQQQSDLLKEQLKLQQAEEERRHLEKLQSRLEFGRMLVRQAKAKLRRRCQQIQESLELDLRILEEMSIKENKEMALKTARREKAKSDAQWMRGMVAEQLELEKQREAELDLLYQEEAARMWTKREAEWEKEKQARERLMSEVLLERQKQIRERMDVLKTKQAESIEEREMLLRQIELANHLTARENREQQDYQRKVLSDLNAQMTERRRQTELEHLEELREFEEERAREEEEEQRIREEEEKIMARHYEPVNHARKYAWY